MKLLIQILFLLCSSIGWAQTFEKCLSTANETTQHCAEKYIKNLTLNNCFSATEKIKSELSKENLKQFCFYQVSEFPTLNSCLEASKKMIVALNHDEAIFECVRQFQQQISQSTCHQLSTKLKYPEKSQHLNRKCDEL
jgi:hypothetical protein